MESSVHPAPQSLTPRSLAGLLDHTLLKPEATAKDIERLCAEAVRHGFKGVCVNPSRLALAAGLLAGCSPMPITVVGFPLGAAETRAKAREAAWCVEAGAREIDMVLNVGALKDGDHGLAGRDVAAVVQAAGVPVKVIIETGLLDDREKETACRLAADAGAAFVKTCTGFSRGGATCEDVALMRRVVGSTLGVKASGGVRTREQALCLVAAGADRIGTSASVVIVEGGGHV